MKRLVALALIGLIARAGLVRGSVAPPDWADIVVDVQADRSVEVSHELMTGPDGFQHLTVSLANPGRLPAHLQSIEVRIPLSPLHHHESHGSLVLRPLVRPVLPSSRGFSAQPVA